MNAKIIENLEIEDGIFRLKLLAPEIASRAVAGTFLNLYLNDGSMLLPRPFGISETNPADGTVTIVYVIVGKGTAALTGSRPGESVRILGPNGNGFFSALRSTADCPAEAATIDHNYEHVILAGGGSGVPPLLLAAHQLFEVSSGVDRHFSKDVRISAFLGYRTNPWYSEPFAQYCHEVFSVSEKIGVTEISGNVIDILSHEYGNDPEKSALILACGPTPMLKAISKWGDSQGIRVLVSMEGRMGCGYGACVGCTIRTRQGKKKVCTDGPVFRAEDIEWSGI